MLEFAVNVAAASAARDTGFDASATSGDVTSALLAAMLAPPSAACAITMTHTEPTPDESVFAGTGIWPVHVGDEASV